jgi:hypothetical protein
LLDEAFFKYDHGEKFWGYVETNAEPLYVDYVILRNVVFVNFSAERKTTIKI